MINTIKNEDKDKSIVIVTTKRGITTEHTIQQTNSDSYRVQIANKQIYIMIDDIFYFKDALESVQFLEA